MFCGAVAFVSPGLGAAQGCHPSASACHPEWERVILQVHSLDLGRVTVASDGVPVTLHSSTQHCAACQLFPEDLLTGFPITACTYSYKQQGKQMSADAFSPPTPLQRTALKNLHSSRFSFAMPQAVASRRSSSSAIPCLRSCQRRGICETPTGGRP